MGNGRELEVFGFSGFAEGHGGKHRGFKGGEGAAELVILRGFQHVGRVQWKKKTDRGGPVGGDGPKKQGEIQAGPRPRFPSEILDGDQGGQGGRNGRRGHGRKKEAGPWHKGGGQEEAHGSSHEGGPDAGSVHLIFVAGKQPLATGKQIEKGLPNLTVP